MATWRVNNSTALGGEVCSPWQANHAYATGARCVCTIAYATKAARAVVFECTSAGTSHSTTQPTWDYTVGNTTADGTGTLVWTARSPSDGTWDNASCYLLYILNHTTIAAGDTVYIDDGHSEALVSSSSYILKGATAANNPIKIICVNKADDSASVGAVVWNNSVSDGITPNGYGYSYGVTYKGVTLIPTAIGSWLFESDGAHDAFIISTSLSTTLTYNVFTKLHIKNAGISLTAATARISVGHGLFLWEGGVLTAASGVNKLLDSHNEFSAVYSIIRDVDLSAVGETKALVDVGDNAPFNILFERCKLPSGSFEAISGTWKSAANGRVKLHHCSSGNAVYDIYESSYEGSTIDETTIVRTGGASNGTTSYSLKMVSSANCLENIVALESPPIHAWTSSTTSKTFTIEGIWDSATNIQDDEIWMELEYPANNTDGLGALVRDCCAILGTPADQTASTETWTGTGGFSNENKFKLSVTVTPGKAGPICARVYLAKASTTVYVDPMITES